MNWNVAGLLTMIDGIYHVDHGNICAGFLVENGQITYCAPILRNRITLWARIAKRVGPIGARPELPARQLDLPLLVPAITSGSGTIKNTSG